MDQRRVVIFQQPNINTRHFSTFLKIVFFSFPIRTLRKRKSNLSLTYGRVCCCSFLPYTHICSEAPELKTKQTKKTIKYIPLPMLIQEKKNFNEPVLFHRLEENAQKGYITRLLGHSGRVCHPNFTITNWLCRFSRLNILIFRDGLTIHLLYFTLLSVKIMWSLRENFPIKTFLKTIGLKQKISQHESTLTFKENGSCSLSLMHTMVSIRLQRIDEFVKVSPHCKFAQWKKKVSHSD